MTDKNLEKNILEYGEKIFSSLGQEQPSSFGMQGLSGKLMEWSMSKPNFKTNLFRLVDVLPTLRTRQSISEHVTQYLGDSLNGESGLLSFGMKLHKAMPTLSPAPFTVKKSVEQMAKMFIAGSSPKDSIKALKGLRKDGIAFTVDLLGEYCLSEKEAREYLDRYKQAIEVLSKSQIVETKNKQAVIENHLTSKYPVCVSVKLSALYSQCNVLNYDKSVEILSERFEELVETAHKNNTLLYVDAEDTAHNEIIYDVYKKVFSKKKFLDFPYPGIVIQAYAKNSSKIVEDIINFAKKREKPVAIRLVKGAYWDHETVIADQNQWENPLFVSKAKTDLQYEYLSKVLLDNTEHCLPAFGSHNIRSLVHACCYAKSKNIDPKTFELQMLFGMARPIANTFSKEDYLVRMYVPVGELIPGMGYLVRRLLENTSNESFLKHSFFDQEQASSLLSKPLAE